MPVRGFGLKKVVLGGMRLSLVRPLVDLLDRHGPQEEGRLALAVPQGLHGLSHAVPVHDLVGRELQPARWR